MLIDAHTHVVAPDAERFPRRETALANGSWWEGADHSVERFAEHVTGSAVDAAVLVQAAAAYGEDNSYVAEAASSDARRFVGSCIVDPTNDGAAARLGEWAQHAGVGGLRLFHIPRPNPPWLASPVGDDIIDAAAELGLSIAVCCLANDLSALRHQLGRRPDVAFSLDHCGFADFSGEVPFREAQPLWDLAEHSNLHVKLTPTLVRLMGADPTALVTALVDRLGAERVLWGSDWPQHREVDASGRHLSYAEQVALVQSWCSHVGEPGRAAIAGGNALRLWPRAWAQT